MGDNDGVDLAHVTEMYKLLGGNVFGDMRGIPNSQLAILPGRSHVGIIMEGTTIHQMTEAFLNNETVDKFLMMTQGM